MSSGSGWFAQRENQQKTLGVAIFMIIFIIYFWWMAENRDFLSDEELRTGAKMKWHVEFEETVTTESESAYVSEGGVHTFELELDPVDAQVGYVIIRLGWGESEEPGVGLCDEVSGTMQMDDTTGYNQTQSTTSGSDTDCNSQWAIQLRIQVTPDYDGAAYNESETNEQLLTEKWSDNGTGRGLYMCDVEVNVNALPQGMLFDGGEDVNIEWEVHTYVPTFSMIVDDEEIPEE